MAEIKHWFLIGSSLDSKLLILPFLDEIAISKIFSEAIKLLLISTPRKKLVNFYTGIGRFVDVLIAYQPLEKLRKKVSRGKIRP